MPSWYNTSITALQIRGERFRFSDSAWRDFQITREIVLPDDGIVCLACAIAVRFDQCRVFKSSIIPKATSHIELSSWTEEFTQFV